ncbi:GNAT family N-acetyltransferase [Fredinandcohnia sp. QZ13]|uniref:GNAT family N-acetyltransferase n=1 Tax=Fredinandcohnia sp. QZ13 TaxID=3073144 RepID=UPI0028531423|nr:GNAT family N-acetyltransferase [Fredinandcohnia sp. QZ13]MDR4890338.1 GNAT family N-acetyltransferase [Fredinandcohnia sp. QZ13]
MKFLQLDVQWESQVINLWNRELGSDFPMRDTLFKQNSIQDPSVLSSGSYLAVNEQDQVIGFVISKYVQDKTEALVNREIGWIQALLVDSHFRKNGIGSVLLEKAEKALEKQGCKTIFLGRDLAHYFPGILLQFKGTKEWFEKRGYQASGIESDLIRIFAPYEKFVFQTPKDIEVSLIENKDELVSFMHRCFPGRWEYEAKQYFENGGTGREFVVFRKDNKIIGFCRINDPESPIIGPNVYWAPLFNEGVGGVGPLGIDKEERKNGYGLAIVKAGISFLRERQINTIIIDWTGLLDFYKKIDFKVWKEYQQYSKQI